MQTVKTQFSASTHRAVFFLCGLPPSCLFLARTGPRADLLMSLARGTPEVAVRGRQDRFPTADLSCLGHKKAPNDAGLQICRTNKTGSRVRRGKQTTRRFWNKYR
jgi:hypothetical protein